MKSMFTLATGLLFLSFGVLADEANGPNSTEKSGSATASPEVGQIEALTVARRLARYGLDQQDPLALIVAARINNTIATRPTDYTKEGEDQGKKAEADAAAEASDQLGSSSYLLEQARELSAGNTNLLALIDESAKQPATRGDVTGPNAHTDRVSAGSTDVYNIKFQGGEAAEVAVIGESGDLDCFVHDENGNLIDSDNDSTSTCALSWRPAWTGNFRIKIRNFHDGTVNYLIMTN